MAYDSLAEFVKALDRAGELKRIKTTVSPDLEIAEITDRVSKAEGPALLFENVEGSEMPLLINTYGSYQRMAMALGVEDLGQVASEIESMIKLDAPDSLLDKIKILRMLSQLTNFPPKTVKKGACQEVVLTGEQASLDVLPLIKCWPLDADRYITLPQVFTHSLKTGQRNVGTYRLQKVTPHALAMHWQIHHDGAAHHREYRQAVQQMPVAIALGGDPIMSYIGTAPLPSGIDELLFAGFLRKSNVEMVPAKTIDMLVPADADIVIEGYIDPDETCIEGPFGDHTGFYSLADEYPLLHITAITHRKNPIYQTIIVGKPPMEDCYMGKATERIFMPLIKTQLPELVDMNLPLFGVFHNFALISIDKRYPYQAKKMMHSFWGLGQLMFSKIIIVVDKDVDVQNIEEVLFYVGSNVDPKRDVTIVEGPVDVLDHASPLMGAGSKMGIDATTKWAEEGYQREWPQEIRMSDEVIALVDEKWKKYGF